MFWLLQHSDAHTLRKLFKKAKKNLNAADINNSKEILPRLLRNKTKSEQAS